MNDYSLTHFETLVEGAKIALACFNVLFSVVLLVKAENLIAGFYSCPAKVEIIKNTPKETSVFDTRNSFTAAAFIWAILVLTLVYWTASKINVVPVSADIGVLTAIFGFTLKDMRNGLCNLKNIQRLLQVRKSDMCAHCDTCAEDKI